MMKKLLIIAMLIFASLGVSCTTNESLYPVTSIEDNNFGYKFIDKNANTVIDKNFDDVILNFGNENAKDYAIVKDEGQIQIINRKGESLIDIDFQNIAEIYGDRAILVKDGRNVLYDLKNKTKILTHDYIKSESNGIFAFMEGGKWGYRDEKVIIVEPHFDEAYSFGKKYAVATKDGAAYRASKDGTKTSLPFEEVVKASDSEYLIGINKGEISLLNRDGDIIFENIEGDIVDVNRDMLLIMKRNKTDGRIKQAIYSVDGKQLQPPIYDDVRFLHKKFFSAREASDKNFALYNVDGTKLTDSKYSYLNADYFNENGGIITAIEDNVPKYLDKNGVELGGPVEDPSEEVIDVIKDRNFYIIKTTENTYFYRNGEQLVKSSPNLMKLGELSYIIDTNTNSPMFFHEEIDPNLNEDLKNILGELTTQKKKYELNLRGDILDVKVIFDDEVKFMYDISRAEKVELDDIFKDEDIKKILLRLAKINKDAKIIGFVLEDDLEITAKDGDKIINKTIDYEKIEPYINKDGGTFFKSVLAPSVNVENK